jgi:hypothetical protein
MDIKHLYVLIPTSVAPVYLSYLSNISWLCAMAGIHCAEYERRGMAGSITCDYAAMQAYGVWYIAYIVGYTNCLSCFGDPDRSPGTLHNLSDRWR